MKATPVFSRNVLATTAVLSLLAASLTSAQTAYYETGFENPPFSPGSVSHQDGWLAYDAQIQSNVVYEGSQALAFILPGYDNLIWREANLSGTVRFDMQINPASLTPNINAFNFALRDSNANLVFAIIFIPDADPASGQLMAYMRGSETPYLTLNGPEYHYTAGAWNQLTVDYNTSAGLANVYLNGVSNEGGLNLLVADALPIASINFNMGHSEAVSGATYIDNFSYASIPEPSALALLSVAAIGYGLRKRRAKRSL